MQETLNALLVAGSPPASAAIVQALGSAGMPVVVHQAATVADCSAVLLAGDCDLAICEASAGSLAVVTAVLELVAERPPLLISTALDALPDATAAALRLGARLYVLGSDATPVADAYRAALRAAQARRQRLKAAKFAEGRLETLELIAKGEHLQGILTAIVRLVEAQGEGLLCSLLLLDTENGCVRHGAAPSLPEAYNRAIDGVAIGPCAGSCGTAAYRRERVIVPDIATHPYWEAYRQWALPHGLRACWSSPIFAPGGREVLGTFAIYYRQPHQPTEVEFGWVDAATALAATAILRHRNVERLARSEARFRQIVSTTHEGVATIDMEARITFVNKRMAEMLGRGEGEMLGRNWLAFTRHPLALGVSEMAEIHLLHRDGHEISTLAAMSPMTGEDGSLVGALGMFADVTEWRKLEAQIALAQRMESLGTLAGGIAHDFNNILTAIIANVGVARRLLPPEHAVQSKLQVVQRSCARASGLVDQILTFSRRKEPQRVVVQLQPVVEKALALVRLSLSPMIEIRTHVSPSVPDVLADPALLQQIVVNLGTNAAYGMQGRPGVLDVHIEGVTLRSRLVGVNTELRAGHYARLTVSDTGRGMDEVTLARIFDPFFTTREPGQGTGLGLSVVLGIVKSHGGAVVVESKRGAGSTFAVYLPPATAADVAAGPEDRPRLRFAHGERILCVDDEEAVLNALAETVGGLGFTPLLFGNSREAIRAFQADPGAIAAVVSDYAMPGISGLEIAREVRRVKPDLPLVLLGGYLDPATIAEARRLGVRDLLGKPGFLEELPGVLSRIFSRPG